MASPTDVASFNNLLLSLPVSIQALHLSKCPLRKNKQLVTNLRHLTQLVGLAIEPAAHKESTHKNHLISLGDIQLLAKHPHVSLRFLFLASNLIDVKQTHIASAVDDDDDGARTEITKIRKCISSLLLALYPLQCCPVVDFYWQWNNEVKD